MVVDKGRAVIAPPETFRIAQRRIACDGSGDVPAALGHPRVWLEIDERGFVDCGYCDRRFVLIGGVADTVSHGEGAGEGAKAA